MTVHRSVDIRPEDVVVRAGIPITSVERTLCDAGLIFPSRMVQQFTDHAIAKGLTSPADLLAFRQRVGEHGRTGVVRLEDAVARAAPSAPGAESGPESSLYRLIVESGLPAPVQQHPVVVGVSRYRFDLAYPDRMIAMEYDGVEPHTRVDRFSADRRRQNDVISAGWLVLRYTHEELRNRPQAVIAQVRQCRHDRSSVSDL